MSRARPGHARAPAKGRDATGPLPGLLRWFQDEILRPHGRGRARPPARKAAIDAVILPSKGLTAAERMEIYQESYILRLLECFADDFPVVRALAGEATFDRLARAYLGAFPSEHYSLNHLGDRFPAFLEGPVRVARRALLRDVARLEHAMSVVFDAPEQTALTTADLEAVPADAWGKARLRPVAALALLALEHDASAVVTAVKQEKSLPPLGRTKTWVAVYRRDAKVIRMTLTEPMFVALDALVRGRPLPEAVSLGARAFRAAGAPGDLEAQVFRWFAEWRAEGFFAAVEVPAPRRRR